MIEAVAQFVRTLDATDQGHVVDLIIEKSHSESATHDSLQALKENLVRCLKYYGTINSNSLHFFNNVDVKNAQSKAQNEKPTALFETGNGEGDQGNELSPAESSTAVLPSDDQNLEVNVKSGFSLVQLGNELELFKFQEGNVFENGEGAVDAASHHTVVNGNGSGDASAAAVLPKGNLLNFMSLFIS